MEETVYDEVVTCDHSYDKRCHTSYVTSFVSVQEEECDENFKKVRSVGVSYVISLATHASVIGLFSIYRENQKPETPYNATSVCEMTKCPIN